MKKNLIITILILQLQIGTSDKTTRDVSDEISKRFRRELFYPAYGFADFEDERLVFVGPRNKAWKKDTHFSGTEHEMYVRTGPYHENMSGHANEGVYHASRILLETPNTKAEKPFYVDLRLIHGSLAARLFCTHHMKETEHFVLDNSFLCDWSARRSIAAWRYYHLCANNVFPCATPKELARDTLWFDLIVGDANLNIGVESIVASMCEDILSTPEGRSRVERARYLERLPENVSRLGSTCRSLTSTAIYAEMEKRVSRQMEHVQEVTPMGPDPAVRIRKISEGAFPDVGEWSRVDVERISWIRANVERFVVRSVGTYVVWCSRISLVYRSLENKRYNGYRYCRNADMLLEVGPQNWGLLDSFRSTIKQIETLDIDANSDTTYNADITKHTGIPSARFDCVRRDVRELGKMITHTQIYRYSLRKFSSTLWNRGTHFEKLNGY